MEACKAEGWLRWPPPGRPPSVCAIMRTRKSDSGGGHAEGRLLGGRKIAVGSGMRSRSHSHPCRSYTNRNTNSYCHISTNGHCQTCADSYAYFSPHTHPDAHSYRAADTSERYLRPILPGHLHPASTPRF